MSKYSNKFVNFLTRGSRVSPRVGAGRENPDPTRRVTGWVRPAHIPISDILDLFIANRTDASSQASADGPAANGEEDFITFTAANNVDGEGFVGMRAGQGFGDGADQVQPAGGRGGADGGGSVGLRGHHLESALHGD